MIGAAHRSAGFGDEDAEPRHGVVLAAVPGVGRFRLST
jgi:hypothetical protein